MVLAKRLRTVWKFLKKSNINLPYGKKLHSDAGRTSKYPLLHKVVRKSVKTVKSTFFPRTLAINQKLAPIYGAFILKSGEISVYTMRCVCVFFILSFYSLPVLSLFHSNTRNMVAVKINNLRNTVGNKMGLELPKSPNLGHVTIWLVWHVPAKFIFSVLLFFDTWLELAQ